MMAYVYSGIVVGLVGLVVGLIDVSAFLIILGSITTCGSGVLAIFFHRRRSQGYRVP